MYNGTEKYFKEIKYTYIAWMCMIPVSIICFYIKKLSFQEKKIRDLFFASDLLLLHALAAVCALINKYQCFLRIENTCLQISDFHREETVWQLVAMMKRLYCGMCLKESLLGSFYVDLHPFYTTDVLTRSDLHLVKGPCPWISALCPFANLRVSGKESIILARPTEF